MIKCVRENSRMLVHMDGYEIQAEILYVIDSFRNYLEGQDCPDKAIEKFKKWIIDVLNGKTPDQVMQEAIEEMKTELEIELDSDQVERIRQAIKDFKENEDKKQ